MHCNSPHTGHCSIKPPRKCPNGKLTLHVKVVMMFLPPFLPRVSCCLHFSFCPCFYLCVCCWAWPPTPSHLNVTSPPAARHPINPLLFKILAQPTQTVGNNAKKTSLNPVSPCPASPSPPATTTSSSVSSQHLLPVFTAITCLATVLFWISPSHPAP